MSDDLVKRARHHILQIEAWGPSMEPDADLVEELADRIEHLESINLKAACIRSEDVARIEQLEHELEWEKESREAAAKKAWEFADRMKQLEAARDGAYAERNRLVALLSAIFPSGIKKTAIPGWDAAWHGCVYIDLPVGQVSWHYHDNESHLFAHLPPYEGEWDGHTTEEKYERLLLASNHIRQTDELLADYMKFADALMTQTNNQNNRIEQLEAALRTLIASCDSGIRMQKIGVSGMSVQTNIQSSWVHNVEAWAVQEARAALAGEKKDD